MVEYAVIAAGGHGKRFWPFSLTVPKEMLPIDGIPTIEYSIQECIEANVKKIIIVVRPNNGIILQHLLANPRYSSLIVDNFVNNLETQLLIVEEDCTLKYGNAAPLITVKQTIEGSKFIVLFADDIILEKNPSLELIEFSKHHKDWHSILGYQTVPFDEVHNFGNIDVNGNDEVLYIRQKPRGKILSNKVIVSRMLFDDNIFEYIDEKNSGELDLGVAMGIQLKMQPNSVMGCFLSGKWVSVDTPDRYLTALNTYNNIK